jgi:hypothetical protein
VSSLRIVSYAINGRGMGHLVRQLAILRWVRRITTLLGVRTECWVLTSSEGDTLARREGFPAFKLPSKAMLRDSGIEPHRYLALARGWVLNAISGLSPDLLLVDTFPGGSFGELVAALEMAKHRVLVARRVRQEFVQEDPYQALLPLYERQIIPDERGSGPILIREREELLDRSAARKALGLSADCRVVYVSLGGGGDEAASTLLPKLTQSIAARGHRVVVGAGPLYQGKEVRSDGVIWMDRYCPMELFAGFDSAVSAGGYNSFHELMYVGVPTVFLPQPRIADDQAERARRAVAAGAGRIADHVEDVADLLENPGSPAAARGLVPESGGKAAAISALSCVLPASDLAHAAQVLTPRLVGLFATPGERNGDRSLALLKLLFGHSPSERAKHSALLLDLAQEGRAASKLGADDVATSKVERVLVLLKQSDLPMDSALALVGALRRKFPVASGAALVDALEILLPCWSRFSDWSGVMALMRAVPTQRNWSVTEFARRLEAWLTRQDDLFDALRTFSKLEGSGARPVDEVLRILSQETAAPSEARETS